MKPRRSWLTLVIEDQRREREPGEPGRLLLGIIVIMNAITLALWPVVLVVAEVWMARLSR